MHPDSLESLVMAEVAYREHKENATYDFSSIVILYSKVFENESYYFLRKLFELLMMRDSSLEEIGYQVQRRDFVLYDYLTQKFSGEDGSLIWEFTFDRDSTTDEANTICLFDVDDVTVSGRSHTWNTWYDIVTVNYRDTLQTSVADLATADYKLINYPNPFSNSTVIKYSLSGQTSSCVVEIYNMQGRKVKTFHRNDLSSGQYSFEWNKIEEMTPGIYLCRLKVNGKYVADRKMLAVP